MANYCTVDDVSILLYSISGEFHSTSQPTDTQVTALIVQKTATIDVYLNAGGISTQPTDSTVLSYFKSNCSIGVACAVARAGMYNSQNVTDTQAINYCTEWKEFLIGLKENPELIAGTTGDPTAILGNQVTNGTVSESDIPVIEDDFTV